MPLTCLGKKEDRTTTIILALSNAEGKCIAGLKKSA
jgi:hypothetical protein